MADNKLQSLTEIFNEKIFRIPDFQRGYSWQESQLEDFWEDLTNLKEDKIHYTGLLTVEPIKKKDVERIEKWQDDLWLLESGSSAYYIIDGQQRLTTAIIFIDQLLKQFEDSEEINFKVKNSWIEKFLYRRYCAGYKSYIFGYEKDNPSDEYFKTKILEQESSTADKVPEKTLYTANLEDSKRFFRDKFGEISKHELEILFKKIVNKFKFNLYEIDDELDVYVTFETMNNRGKPLSNLELLKNRLIYFTTLLDEDLSIRDRLRKDINECWKTIYEYLGKNKEKPLDDDEFLHNHWIMYFKYNRGESSAYSKFLLNEEFTADNIRNGKLTLSDIKNYIASLAKAVKSWFYLFNPEFSGSGYEEETIEWFQKLNRLGMGAFPPLLMAAMIKCPEDKVLSLLQYAEKFVFLVFRLSQRQANTKNNHFYRLANSFYFEENEQNIDKVIGDIDWQTQGEYEDEDEYSYHGWFDPERFVQHIKEQYDKREGYFTWNGLRYFLYEYELHLQEQSRGDQKVSWTDFNKKDTIEHIYPQNPKDDCWKYPFANYSKKDRKKILHSLGNLVLLARSKNSELKNKCFDYKKIHENKDGNIVGFCNGSYSEIEVSYNEEWTPNEILDRGKNLIEFLENRWDINFEKRKITQNELLQLDFVSEF